MASLTFRPAGHIKTPGDARDLLGPRDSLKQFLGLTAIDV